MEVIELVEPIEIVEKEDSPKMNITIKEDDNNTLKSIKEEEEDDDSGDEFMADDVKEED